MNLHRRAVRLVAGIAAAATALAVAPLAGTASAADPLPPLANPIGTGGFCAGAPSSNPFSDLGAESAATRQVILCLVATDLTQGTTPTTYTPGGTVTRRQMAIFVKRTADLFDELEAGSTDLEELPAYDGDPDYDDLTGERAEALQAIGQLTQAGIVGGFGDGTFRPGAPVSRRQMATFVNNLQEFLTGSAYTSSGDYFDDDDGDPGEDNLNALAGVGIFQGDGQGNVSPGANLTRRQMANILLRNAQVNFAAGRIDKPFAGSNDTLTLRASDDRNVIEYEDGVDTTTPDDDRTYTASSLPASAGGYRVTLVDSDNISQAGGRYSFMEDGNTGLADAGTVAARIVSVNGTNVTAAQSVGAIQPVSGTITFTIDGDGTESVTPVIYTDGGANTRLELADNGEPTEAFGVGGATQYIPPEAGDDAPVSGEVLLATPQLAAVDTAGGEVTVYFKAGDTYRIGSSPPFGTVDAATFQAALSPGDSLRTCQSNLGLVNFYSQAGPNEYCLDDAAPANPTDLAVSAGTPRDTAKRLTWTAAAGSVDGYNVYRNAESCANTAAAELVRIAEVPAGTTEYSSTGLTPSTTYCFVVTSVDDGDESTVAVGTGANDGDNTAVGSTSGVVDRPRITSAALTTDAVPTGGAGTDDVITLVFNEPMDPASVDGATFSVTEGGANGDTTTIACSDADVVNGNGVTLAECELGDGADATVANDTLTITLRENGDDANVQGDGEVRYPLTITAITVLKDADDGETVDVAASSDTTIS